ncbi:MAG: hypothetical protein R3C42_06300 [Parvularculaceae bacterium]
MLVAYAAVLAVRIVEHDFAAEIVTKAVVAIRTPSLFASVSVRPPSVLADAEVEKLLSAIGAGRASCFRIDVFPFHDPGLASRVGSEFQPVDRSVHQSQRLILTALPNAPSCEEIEIAFPVKERRVIFECEVSGTVPGNLHGRRHVDRIVRSLGSLSPS